MTTKLRAASFQDGAVSTAKIADDAITTDKLYTPNLGRRNIIINGAMQIAQRSTSETGKGDADGYFTLDRFRMGHGATTTGRYTMSQSSVTDLEGFSNALKIDCTTADTSIAAGEVLLINQRIEGFNLQQLKATSTTTRAMTLSFYAKSNASRAIASEVLFVNGTNRQISKLHTIGTTWARYTMTVPAASSTQIDNDNSHEMQMSFWLHAGSTYTSGTINDDALDSITNANRAVGIGSIFSSTDNTLEITGVQLEVGEQATPFEHRSYGEELALCQRYYYKIIASSSEQSLTLSSGGQAFGASSAYIFNDLPVTMRSKPSISNSISALGNFGAFAANGGGMAISAVSIITSRSNANRVAASLTVASGSFTAGQSVALDGGNLDGSFIDFDSEL